ncbi:MAG TPA: hypothetical protein V6D29_09465 [Leptolyngbyaceae cyanobacterium]
MNVKKLSEALAQAGRDRSVEDLHVDWVEELGVKPTDRSSSLTREMESVLFDVLRDLDDEQRPTLSWHRPMRKWNLSRIVIAPHDPEASINRVKFEEFANLNLPRLAAAHADKLTKAFFRVSQNRNVSRNMLDYKAELPRFIDAGYEAAQDEIVRQRNSTLRGVRENVAERLSRLELCLTDVALLSRIVADYEALDPLKTYMPKLIRQQLDEISELAEASRISHLKLLAQYEAIHGPYSNLPVATTTKVVPLHQETAAA